MIDVVELLVLGVQKHDERGITPASVFAVCRPCSEDAKTRRRQPQTGGYLRNASLSPTSQFLVMWMMVRTTVGLVTGVLPRSGCYYIFRQS